MNLEDNFGRDNVEKLLNEYKDYSDKTIFKFNQVVSNYREHAEFCELNKVNLGFSKIDSLIRGIQPGEVCYIVSPTDVGKTSASINIIKNNLNDNTIIPFFSLENNEYQMFERVIQLETGLQFWEIQKRFINNDTDFVEKCNEITKRWDSCINIVKRISLSDIIPYLKVCEKLTGKKIKFVVIDYVQLVKHMISNEYMKISDIAQTIKEVSLMLRLPIIVLSQTSRMNAKEGLDLYSAKGSGEIENSAQIYFTLETLKEIPITYSTDTRLQQIIFDSNENKGDIRPLILKPHKLKRSKKENIVLILDKKTLSIYEYDKGMPIAEQQKIINEEETPF